MPRASRCRGPAPVATRAARLCSGPAAVPPFNLTATHDVGFLRPQRRRPSRYGRGVVEPDESVAAFVQDPPAPPPPPAAPAPALDLAEWKAEPSRGVTGLSSAAPSPTERRCASVRPCGGVRFSFSGGTASGGTGFTSRGGLLPIRRPRDTAPHSRTPGPPGPLQPASAPLRDVNVAVEPAPSLPAIPPHPTLRPTAAGAASPARPGVAMRTGDGPRPPRDGVAGPSSRPLRTSSPRDGVHVAAPSPVLRPSLSRTCRAGSGFPGRASRPIAELAPSRRPSGDRTSPWPPCTQRPVTRDTGGLTRIYRWPTRLR